jgi:hypothetical protein
VLRLLQLRQPVDIFLSHDWPQHVASHGNMQELLSMNLTLSLTLTRTPTPTPTPTLTEP